MICSKKWETMAEIHARTGSKADYVIETVKSEFRSGLAVCRVLEDPYGNCIEFKAKAEPGGCSCSDTFIP